MNTHRQQLEEQTLDYWLTSSAYKSGDISSTVSDFTKLLRDRQMWTSALLRDRYEKMIDCIIIGGRKKKTPKADPKKIVYLNQPITHLEQILLVGDIQELVGKEIRVQIKG